MSNIVPLRARSEVSRGIQPGVNTPLDDRLAMRIHGEITVTRLLRGLHSVGLTARFDAGSNCVVIEDEVPE